MGEGDGSANNSELAQPQRVLGRGFTPQEIIKAAAEWGLTHVAITDHFETSKTDCLESKDFDKYLETLRSLDQGNGIRVLAGVEIDTNPDDCDLECLPIDDLNELDLILFEYVGSGKGSSLEQLEDLIKAIKIPCGLAHNDLAKNYAGYEPNELADHFASFSVFVEMNTAWPYIRKDKPFYQLAERYFPAFHGKVKLSIGSDMHETMSDLVNLEGPYFFVRRLGLEEDLLF